MTWEEFSRMSRWRLRLNRLARNPIPVQTQLVFELCRDWFIWNSRWPHTPHGRIYVVPVICTGFGASAAPSCSMDSSIFCICSFRSARTDLCSFFVIPLTVIKRICRSILLFTLLVLMFFLFEFLIQKERRQNLFYVLQNGQFTIGLLYLIFLQLSLQLEIFYDFYTSTRGSHISGSVPVLSFYQTYKTSRLLSSPSSFRLQKIEKQIQCIYSL